MLTPQDLREKKFERAVFGGYDADSVDSFVAEVVNDYAALAKENINLTKKLKVLVEKVEEYRSTEDSMRMTLLSAQKLSLQIEQEAREKIESMLAQARDEAERIVREAYTQRATEEARLLEAKRESTQYIDNMRTLCASQLNFLQALDSMRLEDVPSTEDAVLTHSFNETVRNVESSAELVSDAVDAGKEIGRVLADESAPEVKEDGSEPTRLFSAPSASGAAMSGQTSFDNLRFGK